MLCVQLVRFGVTTRYLCKLKQYLRQYSDLYRAKNDRIQSDAEISDHITVVSNRLRHGEMRRMPKRQITVIYGRKRYKAVVYVAGCARLRSYQVVVMFVLG
ncbi:unnamed protein product [Rotaria socialis]|uniref:Uncharacterized protein n=1 Tax=Rotaria socialis TaxID=392032 RepID=A0A820V069_9BILA|nr:unnamed protein product [Rotaria socialis]